MKYLKNIHYILFFFYNFNNFSSEVLLKNPKSLNIFNFGLSTTGITHLLAPLGIIGIENFFLKKLNEYLFKKKLYSEKYKKKINYGINTINSGLTALLSARFLQSYINYRQNFNLNLNQPLIKTSILNNIKESLKNPPLTNIYVPGFGEEKHSIPELHQDEAEGLKKVTNIKKVIYPKNLSFGRLSADAQKEEALNIIESLKKEALTNSNLRLIGRSTGAQTLGLALNEIATNKDHSDLLKKIKDIKLLIPSINKDAAEGYIKIMQKNPDLKLENNAVLTDTIASSNPISKIEFNNPISFIKTLPKFGTPMHSNMIVNLLQKPINQGLKNQYTHKVYHHEDVEKTHGSGASHNYY
jgi:hypothetical protein